MLSKRIISAAIILAGVTLLSGGTAFGTAVPLLDLTENSSTSLTASLIGTSGITVLVENTSADHWTITFSGVGFVPTVTGSGSWTEPDPGSTEGNFVGGTSVANQLKVISDAADQAGMANGTIDLTGFSLDNGVMQVQFNDNGDSTGSVPDATSTLPLLSLSLAGLGIFAKRKKV